MKIEILGSGGSIVTPRPGCYCDSCVKARTHGAPFIRTWPSVFIHDYSILVDTPEDISFQLNRSNINEVNHCLYSHWHGDHVLGRRIWYTLNYDFISKQPIHRKTNIYLTETEMIDFRKNLGHLDHFKKLEKGGLILVKKIRDKDSLFIEDLKITPYPLKDKSVFAFLLEEGNKRVCIMIDDLYGWNPSKIFKDLDLLILPIGIFEFHPVTRERLMDKGHHLLKGELSFNKTISLIEKMRPKKVVFIHIEEHDHIGLLSTDYIEKFYSLPDKKILCAYDGMQINI
jgi:phosphoribosyl 1,2-cyclic phosphate phosphodiesterase